METTLRRKRVGYLCRPLNFCNYSEPAFAKLPIFLKKFLTYYQNDNMIITERDIIKVIISNKTNGGKYYEENIDRSGYAEGLY